MKKFICKNCKAACYSAADQRVCPDCKGELKEVSMTEEKEAPEAVESCQGADEINQVQNITQGG